MAKYILKNIEEKDFETDALQVGEVRGLEIIDSLAPKILLVEANDEAIAHVRSSFYSWIVEEEINYPKPGSDRPNTKN